jgi:hypothetical protein
MSEQTNDDEVDRLLHDAERASDGAAFALRLRDIVNARSLAKKAQRLYAQAVALDPDQLAPAWKETRLKGAPQ